MNTITAAPTCAEYLEFFMNFSFLKIYIFTFLDLIKKKLFKQKFNYLWNSIDIFYRIAVKSARTSGEIVNAGIIDKCEIWTAAQPVWKSVILII